jgi:hypothetical protein
LPLPSRLGRKSRGGPLHAPLRYLQYASTSRSEFFGTVLGVDLFFSIGGRPAGCRSRAATAGWMKPCAGETESVLHSACIQPS